MFKEMTLCGAGFKDWNSNGKTLECGDPGKLHTDWIEKRVEEFQGLDGTVWEGWGDILAATFLG